MVEVRSSAVGSRSVRLGHACERTLRSVKAQLDFFVFRLYDSSSNTVSHKDQSQKKIRGSSLLQARRDYTSCKKHTGSASHGLSPEAPAASPRLKASSSAERSPSSASFPSASRDSPKTLGAFRNLEANLGASQAMLPKLGSQTVRNGP